MEPEKRGFLPEPSPWEGYSWGDVYGLMVSIAGFAVLIMLVVLACSHN